MESRPIVWDLNYAEISPIWFLKPNNSLVGCTGIGQYTDPETKLNYTMTMWRDLGNFILFLNETTLTGEFKEGSYIKLDFYSGGGVI